MVLDALAVRVCVCFRIGCVGFLYALLLAFVLINSVVHFFCFYLWFVIGYCTSCSIFYVLVI